MLNLSQMTVGEALSSIRDISLVVGMIVFGWKARSWVQPAIDFFHNANEFMVTMRKDMQTLLNNHLTHMEADLKQMSGRNTNHVIPLPDALEEDDAVCQQSTTGISSRPSGNIGEGEAEGV